MTEQATPDLDKANLYNLVLRQVAARPDAMAVTFGSRRLSYRDLDALVARIRRSLDDRGIGPGDHVACMVEKSPEALALFLAVLAQAAVYVPVNPGFSRTELATILEDARPRLTVVERHEAQSGLPGPMAGLLSGGPEPGLVEARVPDARPPAPGGAAVCAAMLYTSGTTGRPKGARISHANLAHTFTSINVLWEIIECDRLLHVLPIFHAHGLLMATLCPLFAGAEIVMLPKFDIDATIRLLPEVTVVMAVPTIYGRLLEHPGFTAETCRNVRLATCGSAPLSPELFDAVKRRTGLALIERYGSTEAGMVTANPAGGPKRGSVGLPLPSVAFRLIDADGRSVQQGEVGRIQARGPHVFLGYWQRPDLAAGNFTPDGYFDTGDFGRQDDDGYLYVVGRDKDMIISGGYNVYPREVELALEQIRGVAEAVVFGVPHPDYGEGVVAAIKPAPRFDIDERRLRQAVADRLASYKRPKLYLFLEEFPRNELGKILRSELAARHADAFAVDPQRPQHEAVDPVLNRSRTSSDHHLRDGGLSPGTARSKNGR